MKYLNTPAEYKAAGDSGSFSGYASIFGNIDLGGDIVERGAFKEVVTNGDGMVTALWQHDSRAPIGLAKVRQDDRGLAFEGQLVLEDPMARKALAHMKAGSVRGMSIGFDILPGGAEIMESGVRLLKSLKLWEVSVVTWGMNPLAGVTSAKERLRQITDIRAFEDFLREEGGFSNAQAKLLASGGWRKLATAREETGGGLDEAAQVLEYIRSIKS
jgi:hypothetical protein